MKPYGSTSECKIAILIQQSVGNSSSYLPGAERIIGFLADITYVYIFPEKSPQLGRKKYLTNHIFICKTMPY
jgi:hypothetical protein